ncbi:MAG: bifunctional adenosylcobinamide kinase/adenosylcobinamide-phosphate guanylyltransferase [Desulforhopalus sp.]
MARIILVTGGARSGKSSFALELAESISKKRLFVATCPQLDEEMSERVSRHQREREGRGWITLESELELESVFTNHAKGYGVILLDCITLWVNNLLFSNKKQDGMIDDAIVAEECSRWLQRADQLKATVILVTNEVGLGVVPDNALARRYRDLVGTCNQLIGRRADDVVLVSCGIPLYLKQKDEAKHRQSK